MRLSDIQVTCGKTDLTLGIHLTIDQKEARDFDISQMKIDKACRLLGWIPRVDVSDGIKLIW